MRVHSVAYGSEADRRLQQLVASAKAEDALAPVTVVVPTNSSGISARRMLAANRHGTVGAGNGVAALSLVSLQRLGELLGVTSLAAQHRRPASTPVQAAAIRKVLTDAPGVFESVAGHPSTEEALVRVHSELTHCSSQVLERLAATSRRAADVVRIHRDTRQLLADRWYEEPDLLTAARAAVENGSPILPDLGTVIVHLPQDLSPAAAGLLAALAECCHTEVIVGTTGVVTVDEVPQRSVARMGGSVQEAAGTPARGTRIVSVSDADEEVRTAMTEIIEAARRGVPLDRIAVLFPQREPYARILQEQFHAAGIPFNGTAARPLAEAVLGRWLRELLDLPASDFDRAAVMRLVTSAPVRGSDGRRLPTSRWERVSRDAGVVRGLAGWRDRLDTYARTLSTRADAAESREESVEWRIARDRREAADSEHLAGFVSSLGAAIQEGAAYNRWADLSAWLLNTIDTYLGAEHERDGWPEPEQYAAQRVEAVVDSLAGLDDLGEPVDLEVFRRTLMMELEDDAGHTGDLGDGVLVGTVASALGVDLDTVVVLGLAEGIFPARPQEDPLLHDAERAEVADELPPRRTRISEQHRHLLASLASASDQRVMVFPRGDLRRSAAHSPSRWLLDTVQALTGTRSMPVSSSGIVQVVPSFASRAHTREFPPTEQAHALQWIDDHLRGNHLADHPLAAEGAPLGRATRMRRARRSGDFTPFDGNVARLAAQLPTPLDPEARVSASALETYLTCPHAYLMQYLLRITAVENPEELLEINAAERGSLIHQILEDWLREQLPDPPLASESWSHAARQRLREIRDERFDEFERRGVTGHPRLWEHVRARLCADLERFLDEDDQRRSVHGARPRHVELAFGIDDAGPVDLEVSGHGTLRLRGKIDRVDELPGGQFLVTDYKTGKVNENLGADRPLGDGTLLQLPLYAVAVRAALEHPDPEVLAQYWYVSTKGEFKTAGYHVDESVLDQLDWALGVVLDGIRAGRFPLRPESPGFRTHVACEYCDPDGLGTTNAYRRWERLRSHPDLRTYLTQVEPQTVASLSEQPDGEEGQP